MLHSLLVRKGHVVESYMEHVSLMYVDDIWNETTKGIMPRDM